MKKLISRIKTKFGTITKKSSIYDIIKAFKITRKKIKKRIVLKDMNYIKEKIIEFKKKVKNIPKDSIISIDESSFDTHLTPLYGWSVAKQRGYATNLVRKL
jgi:hypothetical protein